MTYQSTFQCGLERPETDVSLKMCPGYEDMYARGKEKDNFFFTHTK